MPAHDLDSLESGRRSTGARPLHVRNFELSVLTVLALVVLLRYSQELFIPLVLSILFAYALNPFVNLLERFRIHRTIAAALVVISLCAAIASGAYALRQQATVVLDNIPAAVAKIRSEIQKHRDSHNISSITIGKLREAAREIEKTTAEASNVAPSNGVTKVQIEQPALRANDFIWTGSLGLLGLLSDGVLVIFLVFFVLASEDLFKRKLVHLTGNAWSDKRMTVETLNEINGRIERFLLIQVLSSIAAFAWRLRFWGRRFPSAGLLGNGGRHLQLVPYIGPMFVGVDHNHVVQAFSTNTSDNPFRIAVLPKTPGRYRNL
jgi:predicted PurR-regulated permease PerM